MAGYGETGLVNRSVETKGLPNDYLPKMRAHFLCDGLISLAILLTTTAVFAYRIYHTISLHVVDDAVLGADAGFQWQQLIHHARWPIVLLHPLEVVWTSLTIKPLSTIGIGLQAASALSFGGIVGVGAAALYGILRLLGTQPPGATALVGLTLSSFNVITGLSVIDSYATTFAAICFAILILLFLVRRLRWTGVSGAFIAGAMLAFPASANLPAGAYAIMSAGVFKDQLKSTKAVVWRSAVSILTTVFGIIVLIASIRFKFGYSSGKLIDLYASTDHFFGTTVVDLVASITSYAFIAPLDIIRCRYLAVEWSGYLERPFAAVALTGWWVLLVGGTAIAFWRRLNPGVVAAAWAANVTVLIFYTYFEPQAILVYAPQMMPGVAIVISTLLIRWPRLWIAVATLAMLSFAVNAPVLFGSPIDNFANACPPPRPVRNAL